MNFIKNKKMLFLFIIAFSSSFFGVFAQRSSTYPQLSYDQKNNFCYPIKYSTNTKPLTSWNTSPYNFIDDVNEGLDSFLNGDFFNQGDFFNFYQKFRHYFLLEYLKEAKKKRKELGSFFKTIFSVKKMKNDFYNLNPDNLDFDPEVKFDYNYFSILGHKKNFQKLSKAKEFEPYLSNYSSNTKTILGFTKRDLLQKKELISDNKAINFLKKNTNSKLCNLSKTTIGVIINLLKRMLSIEFEEGHFLVKMLGKGSIKIVFESDAKKAIAIFAMNFSKDDKENIKKEISFFKNYKHKNITQCFSANEKLGYMVQELAISDLFEYLNSNKDISDFEKLSLFKQITKAILYLHENNIVYRDLKSENILLFKNSKGKICAKLADFEAIEYLNSPNEKKQAPISGTLVFIDPEVFYESTHNEPIHSSCCLANDIYSLGLLAYNIFSIYKDNFLDVALFLYDNKYFFDKYPVFRKRKFNDYFIENIEDILDCFHDHIDNSLPNMIADLVFDCTREINDRPNIKIIDQYLGFIKISNLQNN